MSKGLGAGLLTKGLTMLGGGGGGNLRTGMGAGGCGTWKRDMAGCKTVAFVYCWAWNGDGMTSGAADGMAWVAGGVGGGKMGVVGRGCGSAGGGGAIRSTALKEKAGWSASMSTLAASSLGSSRSSSSLLTSDSQSPGRDPMSSLSTLPAHLATSFIFCSSLSLSSSLAPFPFPLPPLPPCLAMAITGAGRWWFRRPGVCRLGWVAGWYPILPCSCGCHPS